MNGANGTRVRRRDRSGGAAGRLRRAGGVVRSIREDLETVLYRDPSVDSLREAAFHPTLPAVWTYRVAHHLSVRGYRITARFVSNVGRLLTGVEIHPAATIGRRLFIDHGSGVVIGETAVIGDDATLYHQVTLGAVGWWRDNLRGRGERRHPRLGDRVVVGANATLLGAIVVGNDAMIGANALVTSDVPAGQHVVAPLGRPEPPRNDLRKAAPAFEHT